MKFVTKRSLPRRAFLRGAGAALALPLLDAMTPALTAMAQTPSGVPSRRRRLGFVYVPNGVIVDQFVPAKEGANFEISPILKPLEPFREYVNVMSGFYNTGENGHSVSSGTYLSGTVPAKGNVQLLNTTVDQVIAQKIGQDSTFPSMEFATEDHTSHLGSCAGDFLCSYMSTISWRTPTQPLPMEINPRVVFETMFGGDQSTPEERAARIEQNTSILDGVRESVRDLETGLGARDKARLEEYLENVREIERFTQSRDHFSVIFLLHSVHTNTPRLIDQRLAIFAYTTRPILIALHGDACWFTAFRADEHHVRDIDRSLKLDAPRVDVATSLRLHLFLVLGANIYTLHHNAAVFE